jgi:major membrane immunogen (membrane-anchored lipoprotein)
MMRFPEHLAHTTRRIRNLKGWSFALGLIIITTIILPVGCSKNDLSGPSLVAKGYRTAISLDGGGYGNSMKTEDKDKIFLVVTVSVPTGELIPTEAEYRTMKHEQDSSKIEAGEKKISFPAKEYCRIYSPQRFTVIFADGRGYHGQLIARDNSAGMGFSSSCMYWQSFANSQSPEVPKNETVNVAFVVDGKDCRPPFQIQLDRNTTVPVPDTKL